ncbi:MAG: endonuclease/exonuclease/phosphatase family protein [Vulcanimicrobiota bacterium]
MSIDPLKPNQIKLSDIRPRYESKKQDWTKENTRVMPEPGDHYLPEDQKQEMLQQEYQRDQKEKITHDLNQQYAKLISTEDFKKKDNLVITHENSDLTNDTPVKADNTPTVLNDFGSFTGPAPQPLSMDTIEKHMNLSFMDEKAGEKIKTAGIGTFNIEWLGVKDRSEEDYKSIAQVIKDSKATVMGIQEIANLEGLQKVLKHLPNYGYILGKSSQQMVGVIFDKDRVQYDKNSIDQLENVTLGNPGLRPPLSVQMKVDNFDFNFVVMHLKARFDPRSVRIRNKQAKLVNAWLADRLANNPDKDVIIVGDYNDKPGSSTLQYLDTGNLVDYPTDEADAKGIYSNVRYKEVIDHGAVSREKGGAAEEYIDGSLRTVDEKNYKNWMKNISDHKPIVFDVRSDQDND